MAQLFRQAEIARRLKSLFEQVGSLDRGLKQVEKNTIATDLPTIEHMVCPFVFFPVRVTAVNTANKTFYAWIQVAGTSDSTPWIDSTELSTHILVNVPPSIALPAVGDWARADFTGNYGGSFSPRYGMFSGVSTITSVTDCTTLCTCTTISVITDFQVSGLELQIKTRYITVVAAGDESAWTVKHTGTECPPA